MLEGPLEIKLRDSVYEPGASDRTIHFDASLEDRPRYRVWLYLEGPDLPYVKKVTYHLHPTFPNPVREVRRTPANPKCAMPIWTWGLFEVRADVEDKGGGVRTLRHELTYDREITADARYEERELAT